MHCIRSLYTRLSVDDKLVPFHGIECTGRTRWGSPRHDWSVCTYLCCQLIFAIGRHAIEIDDRSRECCQLCQLTSLQRGTTSWAMPIRRLECSSGPVFRRLKPTACLSSSHPVMSEFYQWFCIYRMLPTERACTMRDSLQLNGTEMML